MYDVPQLTEWCDVPSAADFPSIGNVLLEGGSKIRPGAAPLVLKPYQRSSAGVIATELDKSYESPIQHGPRSATDVDTSLARHGSNFGLPIALNLTLLMKGGIGIAEVGLKHAAWVEQHREETEGRVEEVWSEKVGSLRQKASV